MRRILVLLALALAALTFAQDTPLPPAVLRAGDEVVVHVIGFETKFDGDYIIADDGRLTGVGFGSVDAAGKTVDQLRHDITELMKKRLKDPVVEVVLKHQLRQVVYVVGGIHTEPINFISNLDLRQVIAVAGLTDTPDMIECLVSRKGEPVRHIDLPSLLRGDSGTWDGPLQADDVVTLLDKIFRVSVSGEVNLPGDYPVAEDGIIAAIAQAKGVTPNGTLSNVLVFRGPDVYTIDVSAAEKGNKVPFTLKPGDSIVVRKSENAVYVLGEVRMPGRYVVPDGKQYHAADLLAVASGLTPQGSLRRMALVRPDKDGKMTSTQYNLDEFVKDGKMKSNPLLQSGDIVVFSPQKAQPFISLNQIASTAFLLNGIIKR